MHPQRRQLEQGPRFQATVMSRDAMPITTDMAAANMIAPTTSNRISVNDIAHQAMRPQPAVTAGACSEARA
jgi:hypothetical protein